jgi:hypothetical protein
MLSKIASKPDKKYKKRNTMTPKLILKSELLRQV